MGLGFWGLGFRVLGFGVLGFWDLGFRALGLGFWDVSGARAKKGWAVTRVPRLGSKASRSRPESLAQDKSETPSLRTNRGFCKRLTSFFIG